MVPNLLDFTPTLTAAEQVSRITVRGWNPRTKQPIAYAATVSDLPKASGRGVSGPEAATTALGGREEVVVDAQRSGTYCVGPADTVWLTRSAGSGGAISLRRRRALELQFPDRAGRGLVTPQVLDRGTTARHDVDTEPAAAVLTPHQGDVAVGLRLRLLRNPHPVTGAAQGKRRPAASPAPPALR